MISARNAWRFTSVAVACLSLAACATAPAQKAGLKPTTELAETPTGGQQASLYGLFLAGQAALDKGSSREAAEYLERASALAPDADFLKEKAFTAALVTGDIDRSAGLAPGPGEGSQGAQRLGVLVKAVSELADGHGKEAYALLSAPQTGQTHMAAVELLRPWAAAAAGDWTAAIIAPTGIEGDKLTGIFGAIGRAQLLERAGKLPEAETAYKALLPDRQGIFALSYGAFLERRGRRAEAVALYDRLLSRGRDASLAFARARAAANKPAPPLQNIREGAAQALIGPAAMLMASRSGDMGLAYLRLALKLDPKLDEAWVLVGDAMGRVGDRVAAREAYEKVRTNSSEYQVARGRLAWSYNAAGEADAALKLARETLDAAPSSIEAMSVYADLLRENGRYGDSVAVMDKLIAQVGDGVGWRHYYLRGVALEQSGRWDLAQADLQRALKINPNSAETLNYLGFGWADRGQHLKQALELLQKAALLEPRSGAIADSLGWARYRVGDYRAAVRDLENAVLLEPSDPDINDHLGDAYYRIGRKLEADFQWRRVLTLDPSDKIRTSAEAKIKDGLPPATPVSLEPRQAASVDLPKAPG
jgi:tetratricopeptide (TPR) repeat protein